MANLIEIVILSLICCIIKCDISKSVTTMSHLIDLDSLPHRITHKGCIFYMFIS